MRFSGFAHFQDGKSPAVASLDEAIAACGGPGCVLWIDVDQPRAEDLRALRTLIPLEDETIDDLLGGQQRPRMDEYEHYTHLIFYSVRGESDNEGYFPRKLSILLAPRIMVTVHGDSLLCTRSLLDRCAKQSISPLSRGVDILACDLVDIVADDYQHVAEHYEEELEDLEELSLYPDRSDGLLEKVGALRRCMIDLRRIAVAELEVMQHFARGELAHISRREAKRARHASDHLMKVVERMDAFRELLHGVHDNYRAVLASRGNDVMRVLTAFAGITLPLSLMAGVFGMNFPLPLQDHPWTFWTVMVAMGSTAIGMAVYFRRKGWL